MAGRPRITVIALGGHAFVKPGQRGTIQEQFANSRLVLQSVAELVAQGHHLVLTHGNGPQIGNSLIRHELTREVVPDLPLGVLVANTEGSIGYMIEQSFLNLLRKKGVQKPVITVLTQVIIDRDDPSLSDPRKPVGPFYTEEQAKEIQKKYGYPVRQDSNRGWRRVVPSPYPLEIVEWEAIRLLLASGCIVVAAGGGGIPVVQDEDGSLEGVDCVIDKDLASMVLARDIGADCLLMLTAVDKVYRNFGTDQQEPIETLTVAEARLLLEEGEFAAGSMGPKVRAAVEFLESGGRTAFIGLGEEAAEVLDGRTGTQLVP